MKFIYLLPLLTILNTGFSTTVLAESKVTAVSATVKLNKTRTIKLSKGYRFVNLYKNPSSNAQVLMRFNGGERVTEIETKGSMMKVNFGNKTGWIVLR